MGTKLSGICSSSKLSWSPQGVGSSAGKLNGGVEEVEVGISVSESDSERRVKVLPLRTSPTCAEDLGCLGGRERFGLNILESLGEWGANTVEDYINQNLTFTSLQVSLVNFFPPWEKKGKLWVFPGKPFLPGFPGFPVKRQSFRPCRPAD